MSQVDKLTLAISEPIIDIVISLHIHESIIIKIQKVKQVINVFEKKLSITFTTKNSETVGAIYIKVVTLNRMVLKSMVGPALLLIMNFMH